MFDSLIIGARNNDKEHLKICWVLLGFVQQVAWSMLVGSNIILQYCIARQPLSKHVSRPFSPKRLPIELKFLSNYSQPDASIYN